MGALTMDLIELEIKRTEHRAAEEGIVPAAVAQKALDAASGKVQLQDRWVVAMLGRVKDNARGRNCSQYTPCTPLCCADAGQPPAGRCSCRTGGWEAKKGDDYTCVHTCV